MRKIWRRRLAAQQRKASARLSEAIGAAFSLDDKGKPRLTGPAGPAAVALGECALARAEVDKDTLRVLNKAGIG